ncbi:MAG: hypothetical protein ACYS47_11435 [Planctomycetota bacterium]|jgi:hypothetical protein
MKRVAVVLAVLLLWTATLRAEEEALPYPDDVEHAIVVVAPRAVERQEKETPSRFRFTVVVAETLAGCLPEGVELTVLVPSPLPAGWKKAVRSLAEEEPARGLIFLRAAEKVTRNERFEPVPPGADFGEAGPEVIQRWKAAIDAEVKRFLLDLDAPEFSVRHAADRALRQLGFAAEERLRAAAKAPPSPEVALRVKGILAVLPRRKREKGVWVIHQPNLRLPGVPIVVWKSPAREDPAFQLVPGTRIEIIAKRIEGKGTGSPRVMCKIRATGGRVGWVDEASTRYIKPSARGLRPLAPGEKITEAFFEKVYMAALDRWFKVYRARGGRERDVTRWLNETCREVGFQDWGEFAKKTVDTLGPQRFQRIMRRITRRHMEMIMEAERARLEEEEGGRKGE